MATKLFDGEALVAGTTMESDTITGIGDLVLDVEYDSVAPHPRDIKISVLAWEGDNLVPKPVLDESLKGIHVNRKNPSGMRINVVGVNAEKAQVNIEVPASITAGTVTIEATGTANPNSDITVV